MHGGKKRSYVWVLIVTIIVATLNFHHAEPAGASCSVTFSKRAGRVLRGWICATAATHCELRLLVNGSLYLAAYPEEQLSHLPGTCTTIRYGYAVRLPSSGTFFNITFETSVKGTNRFQTVTGPLLVNGTQAVVLSPS